MTYNKSFQYDKEAPTKNSLMILDSLYRTSFGDNEVIRSGSKNQVEYKLDNALPSTYKI